MALHEIYTAQDLKDFRDLVNAGNLTESAILMNDIDLEGSESDQWVPIADSNFNSAIKWSNGYTGTFDGNGHTISGIHVNTYADPLVWTGRLDVNGELITTYRKIAFIGTCTAGSIIKNLTLEGSIYAGDSSAGFVAEGYDCTILNCINKMNITGDIDDNNSYSVAGIIAYADVDEIGCVISNCINEGNISGYGDVSGIVPYAYDGRIINCINKGNIYGDCYITGIAQYVGGSSDTGSILNCVNIGDITARDESCAGIVLNMAGEIHNCVNMGTITGLDDVGGFACYHDNTFNVSDCVNEGNVVCLGGTQYGAILADKYSIEQRLYDGTIGDYMFNMYYLDTSSTIGSNIVQPNTFVIPYTTGYAPTVSCLIDKFKITTETLTPELYPYSNPSISTVTFSDWVLSNTAIANVTDNIINFSGIGETNVSFSVSFTLIESSLNMGTVINDKILYSAIEGEDEPEEPEIPAIVIKSSTRLYKIYTAQDLKLFRNKVNSGYTSISAILMNDIDLEGFFYNQWAPIGDNNIDSVLKYLGTFDGNGHTVSGIYIDTSNSNQAFIGLLGETGKVQHLTVEGIIYCGTLKNAGLVSECFGGTIDNCINRINLIVSDYGQYIGGIVGYVNNTDTPLNITNCVNEANICEARAVLNEQKKLPDNIAGIVGFGNNCNLHSCLNIGNVYGYEYVSGIATSCTGTICNCVNKGNITGYYKNTSGINTLAFNIDHCTNMGIIYSNYSPVGGIVALANNNSIIKDCANHGNITSTSSTNIGAIVGESTIDVGLTEKIVNTYYLSSSCNVGIGGSTPIVTQSGVVITYTTSLPSTSFLLSEGYLINTETTVGKYYPKYIYGETGKNFNTYLNKISSLIDDRPVTLKNHANGKLLFDFTYTIDTDFEYSKTLFINIGINLEDITQTYEIYTKDDLINFRNLVNSGEMFISAILMNDIDLQGSATNQWIPIAETSVEHAGQGFSGTFDGNGHTISGIYIDNNTLDYQGFIGLLDNGVIKNLTLEGTITGSYYLGGIAGQIYNGKIENSINRIQIKGMSHLGGIVGGVISTNETYIIEIINCVNEADINGANYNSQYYGGIAGSAENCNIINCINKGSVIGYDRSAGIVSEFYSGNIINCVNIGNITAVNQIASGIVNTSYSSDSIIRNCVNMGIITGPNYIAGIIYYVANSNDIYVQNCVNEGNIVCDGDCYGAIYGEIESSINNTSHNYYLDSSCNKAGYIYDADIITTIDEVFETYTTGNAPTVVSLIEDFKTNKKIITPHIFIDDNKTDVLYENYSVSDNTKAKIENDTVVLLPPTVPKKEIIIDKL